MAHSKQDYAAVAAILAAERERVMPQDTSAESVAVHKALEAKRFLIASRLADYFERGNRRFDRERFLDACAVNDVIPLIEGRRA